MMIWNWMAWYMRRGKKSRMCKMIAKTDGLS